MSAATREEIRILRDEINHLETLIANEPNLIPQRSTLLRRLNLIQPPIGQLPREILSEIFQALLLPSTSTYTHIRQFASVPDGFKSPFVLGAVSSLWREVAFSTRSLWTSFRWAVGEKSPHNILEVYLKNSGTLPIHLELEFSHFSQQNALFHPWVDKELVKSMSRIQTLKLYQPPPIWEAYIPDKLPALENLDITRIDTPDNSQGDVLLGQCTSLRRLALCCMIPPDPGVSLHYQVPTNLNTLCLRLIPIDAALKILECCRELVELSLSFLTEPHIRDLNDVSMQCWHREPLFFRQLESFEWYRGVSIPVSMWGWIILFCNQVRMPALRTLALRDTPAPGDPASASERLFLIRHAMTVSTLHLEEVSRIFPEWTYINLFTSDSAIESLTIHKFDAAAIAGLIVLLTPESSGQARVRVPKLRSLEFSDSCSLARNRPCFLGEHETTQLEALLLMLERRLEKETEFRLGFSGVLPAWTYVARERLMSLVRKGVRLEVTENGRFVDWSKR